MKRLLKFLFIFLIILLPFNIYAELTNFVDEYNSSDVIRVESGSYELIIEDNANILSDEDKIKLQDEMTKLLEYGNVALVTNERLSGATSSKASSYYYEHFGVESGTIFYIDMNINNRYIYIYSDGANSKVITDMKANTITDNVYSYASNKDYYGCASKAFEQIHTVLAGGKISEPLRFICSIILALISSFMLCFIYAYLSSRKTKASVKELMSSADTKLTISNFNARITGEDRVYNPPSSSSSGSSGGGGGGGGGGSGGGHRF